MRRILIIISTFCIMCVAYGIPQIYPTILELELDSSTVYSEITISNTSDESVKYELQVKKDTDDFDISPYVQFFPRVMEIKPSKQKKVRIALKGVPYNDLPDGELRALLEIKEIPSKLDNNYKSKEDSTEEFSTNVSVMFNIAMMIYARKGENIEAVNIGNPVFDGENVDIELTNTGNVSFRPKASLKSGGTQVDINTSKVLRGGVQNLKFKIDDRSHNELILFGSDGKELSRKILRRN